jgi:glucosylceramidase
MKTGGSMCGGFMREEFVECYADYIVKFVQAYAEHGIKISAITPQNECNTQQAGRMPACIWHPETEARFIRVLRQKLEGEALDVKIWMYDHNFNDTQRVLWSLENCEGLSEDCDGVAFHYYRGTIEQTKIVQEAFPSIELHFTEGGPRLTDHYDTDWCKWGLMMVKALKAGYRSFTGWNLMLDEMGGPNVGPFLRTCGGLVTRDSRSGELTYSGQYRAFSHIAPYITPTSLIYPISVSDAYQVPMSAYPKYPKDIEGVLIDNRDGKKVAILINPNDYGCQVQIEVDGQLWYLELYADSILTMEIE